MNTWTTQGASVRGPSHVIKGTCNQDAWGWSNRTLPLIALSDGHGGDMHDLSDVGARAAVYAAIRTIESFFEALSKDTSVQDIKRMLENTVTYAIWEHWQAIVKSDKGTSIRRFGCTLLVAWVWNGAVYFVQCGDGRCTAVGLDGTVYFPFEEDERHINGVTTSMGAENAWLEMNVAVLENANRFKLIGLFSDGVQNAYPQQRSDDAIFYASLATVPSDLVNRKLLYEKLSEAAFYSKDDTTGALLLNTSPVSMDQLKIVSPRLPQDWQLLSRIAAESDWAKRVEIAIHFVQAVMKKPERWEKVNFRDILIRDGDTFLNANALGDSTIEAIVETLLWQKPPSGRLSAYTSLVPLYRHLQKVQCTTRYCHTCHHFFEEGKMECQCMKASSVTLETSAGTYQLLHNTKIYLHHLMPLYGVYDPLIACVVQHPKHPSVWGLKNCTHHSWQVGNRSILSGSVLTIQKEQALEILNLNLKISLNPGSEIK